MSQVEEIDVNVLISKMPLGVGLKEELIEMLSTPRATNICGYIILFLAYLLLRLFHYVQTIYIQFTS